MVLSIWERIKGFLFRPSETFDASKEDTIGDAFKYFVVLLAIYAVLFSIMVLVAFSAMSWMVEPWAAMMGLTAGPLLAVAMFVLSLISGIIAVFIMGLWMHIWVYIVGGRKGVKQTIKALMYGATPSYLLGWIPFIGIIAGIWALIVEIIGIRQLHELSTGKAVLAFILAIIIPAIIAAIVTFAALITMPKLRTGLGPGFGGF
ncbi:MAG: YIP1 family protein [Methanophagales archaeon]|nr:YIP1 family protein [Methanophagales archaeon]